MTPTDGPGLVDVDVADPSTTSAYWFDAAPSADLGPVEDVGSRADAVVVGAGIAGLLIAEALLATGRTVTVLEAGRVAEGTTGSTTAKVTALHGLTYHRLARQWGPEAAAAYAGANQRAIDNLEQLVSRHGIDCGWYRGPAVTYTVDPERVPDIEDEVDAAAAAGLPVHATASVDLPFPVAAAVRCEEQAMVHPRRLALGVADALRRSGVTLAEHARVVAVEEGPPHVVHLEDGRHIEAPIVVLATLLPVYDPGGFFAKVSPVRSYALAVTVDGPAPSEMCLSIDDPTRSVRPVVPGGSQLVVGGRSHRVGEGGDTREHHAELLDWTRATFPVRAVHAQWSAHDLVPVDGVPYIGAMPHAADGIMVATGFNKWGFTTAAVAGELVAALAEGRPHPAAAPFDASRSSIGPSSIREMASGAASVAGHLVGDRISLGGLPAAESLAPGAAAIADHEGDTVAAFRDPDGRLHIVSATCTHMGCRVVFNTAERSWDCPCHGSRFGVDGRVLCGPAVLGLEAR